jgi:spectinomycin phosphotransferase
VRDRPDGVGDDDLRLTLAEGWRIEGAALRYAPVGGGSYHWEVRDAAGSRWFVTVDDLDDKAWLGDTRPTVMAGLRSAMDTARALRRYAGLEFVVAPVPACDGATLRPVGPRHAVAVFGFLSGRPGRFGQALPASERAALVDMLAALHEATPVVGSVGSVSSGVPVGAIGLPQREVLDAALRDVGRPWRAGPFAEPARTLLAGAADHVRALLEVFDRLAGAVRASEFVITHGEPHPGNVMRVGPRRMLIDWDTVGLGPPERDLWMVVSGTGEESRRYADLTGRTVDQARLELYRLRWALDDISAFVNQLRAEHRRTADSEQAWLALKQAVERACTEPASNC